MRIPIFALVIAFVIWLNFVANRASRRDDDRKRAFWERENAANSVRKQSLDGLSYIHIPEDLLPADLTDTAFTAHEAAARIVRLRESDAKIVNLTGYSNTDLKMEYGAANLSVLTEYDANYTTLVTALQECGKALYEAGRFEEAARILEFSAMTGTDISACYRLLTDLYKTKLSYDQEKAADKIAALLPIAESLRSLSRDGIVKIVSEAL